MKLIKFILLISCAVKVADISAYENSNKPDNTNNINTVDKILASIYHPENTIIILQSDLRPGLEGVEKTLKQIILEKLMELEAQKYKITVSDSDVDRNLAQVQKQNNVTLKDIKRVFKEGGLTFDEGREQLRRMQMIEMLVDAKVKSKINPSKEDVKKHYDNNPIYDYEISSCLVPFNSGLRTLQKISLQEAIDSGDIIKAVKWDDPIKISSNDIDKDNAYIHDLKVDSVILRPETQAGFPLVRIVSKKAKSLEEREKDILMELRKERFEKAFKDFEQQLFDTYGKYIKYNDGSDKLLNTAPAA